MTLSFSDIWNDDKKVKKEAEEIKIKAVGIKEAGNDLVNFSDSIIAEVNRREQLFQNLQGTPTNTIYLSGTTAAVSGSMMAGLIDINRKLDEATTIFGVVRAETIGISGTSSTMSSALYHTAKSVNPPSLNMVNAVKTFERGTSQTRKEELKEKVKLIKKELSSEVDISWSTYHSATNQAELKQAAHSMREALSTFLQILSPDENIINSSWYEKPEDTKISQKQRIRYAIAENKLLDENSEIFKQIIRLEDEGRNLYQRLSTLAHYRKDEISGMKEELGTYLDFCQEIMLGILNLRTILNNEKKEG